MFLWVVLSSLAATTAVDYTELSLEELSRIRVTTVSRSESTVGRSPAAVFVITSEMIRRSGANVLPELFRMVPGADVARIDSNKWAVGVRGFNDRFNGKLLVQVDGRTVYNPLSSGVYWDAVDYPLTDIERIEVIRGPGASVWGANAVNGIINIITKPAQETRGGVFVGGGGTEERAFGTLRYGAGRGPLQYRVYAKGFSRPEQFSPIGDPHDAWWGGSGGGRLDWKAGPRDAITLQGDLFRSEAGRKDMRPMRTAPFALTNVETEITDGANLLAAWTRRIDEGSSWSLRAYWDRFDREGDNGFVDLRWDTFDLDFQYERPWGARQTIVAGLGFRYVDALLGPSAHDDGFAVSFPPPDRTSPLWSAFLQDQIALVPHRLVVTLGSKIEHNDFTGVELQPTARVLWTPTERQSAWAAISRALRTPTLSEDGIGSRQLPASTSPPIFPRLTGNLDYGSEEVVAYELGYRVEATRRLSLDAALFYNDYDGLRVVVPGPPIAGVPPTLDVPLVFQNRMGGETYGAELAATGRPSDRWRLYAAAWWLTMKLRADPTLAAGTRAGAEAPQGQSPKQQVYLQSSWDVSSRLQLDMMGRFVSRLHGFNPSGVGGGDVIDAYTSLDAHLSWKAHARLELDLVGQNLLASHHPETGTAQFLRSSPVEIRRGVFARAKVVW